MPAARAIDYHQFG